MDPGALLDLVLNGFQNVMLTGSSHFLLHANWIFPYPGRALPLPAISPFENMNEREESEVSKRLLFGPLPKFAFIDLQVGCLTKVYSWFSQEYCMNCFRFEHIPIQDLQTNEI